MHASCDQTEVQVNASFPTCVFLGLHLFAKVFQLFGYPTRVDANLLRQYGHARNATLKDVASYCQIPRYRGIFTQFMSMWENQILARGTGIKKKKVLWVATHETYVVTHETIFDLLFPHCHKPCTKTFTFWQVPSLRKCNI